MNLLLQLVAIRLEFFAGWLELAAAGRVLMAESARLAARSGKCRRGIGRSRNRHGQRACDQ